MTAPGVEMARVELGPAAALFRSLGDPGRLVILGRLTGAPARVVHLVPTLGLAQSTVSKHRACLRDFRLAVRAAATARSTLTWRIWGCAIFPMTRSSERHSAAIRRTPGSRDEAFPVIPVIRP
jgi:hypothetical protein